ncbi:class I SAM-dependent methyltransferase [Planctomycetota bacterium]
MEKDDVAVTNEAFWDREVEKRVGCTIPWLDLDADVLRQFARGELEPVPELLARRADFPAMLLADVEGRDVLCLGAGGGQQSAVYGVLGARVTVVDLSQRQLEGDRRAAEHYGYEIRTVHADMRDLSCLDDESFDQVYGTGSCYIPDVRDVFAGVARALRPGGAYRADFMNPYTEFVDPPDWDGVGYRITRPYAKSERHRQDGAMEFRHYLDEVFNGLLDLGFSIRRVLGAPHDTLPDPGLEPGSYRHCGAFTGGGFTIVALKG